MWGQRRKQIRSKVTFMTRKISRQQYSHVPRRLATDSKYEVIWWFRRVRSFQIGEPGRIFIEKPGYKCTLRRWAGFG
jgi:hypothetical protein